MGLNDAPGGERVHIGFFGVRNAGKSSVVNAVTGQDLAIVSEFGGTTTDPVYKAMELLLYIFECLYCCRYIGSKCVCAAIDAAEL